MSKVRCGQALWTAEGEVIRCDRIGKADTHPMRRGSGGLGLGHPIHTCGNLQWIVVNGTAEVLRRPVRIDHE